MSSSKFITACAVRLPTWRGAEDVGEEDGVEATASRASTGVCVEKAEWTVKVKKTKMSEEKGNIAGIFVSW